MDKKRVFCPDCGQYVDATIESFPELMPIRGVSISTTNRFPICPYCGERIADAELVDDNLKRLYEHYRKNQDIPTPKELVDIRTRYGLSQKAFAEILGIGVASIQRYEKGALPTDAHAHILRETRNPLYLRNRLQKNPKIFTDGSFAKAKKAIDEEASGIILYGVVSLSVLDAFRIQACEDNGWRDFNEQRLKDVVLYFSQNISDLYKTKLNKALWYLDFDTFKQTGRGFTGLRYARADYGPVPDNYELLLAALIDGNTLAVSEKGDSQVIAAADDSQTLNFDANELRELDRIARFVNSFKTTTALSQRSHQERAWLETESGHLIRYDLAQDLLPLE